MSERDDAQADRLLLALSREGFGLPFMARSRDYVDSDSTGEERRAQLDALHAADDEAWRENQAALRRALDAAAQDPS